MTSVSIRGASLSVLLVTACGFGGADGAFEGATGDETGFDSDEGDEGDGDGDGEDGEAWDLGAPGGTGTGDFGPICEPDCGPNGVCVDVGDATGVCECDDGYRLDGALGCAPCPSVDAQLPVDVPVVDVTVAFTLAGSAAPASEYQDANLYLENPRRGDRVWLGNTHDAELAARVVPGLYDVVYEHESGDEVPVNARAVLRSLEIVEDAHLVIDAPAVFAQGAIRINGAAPPASEYDDGLVVLRNPATGEETVVGNTHDGAWGASLIAGTYDVYYRLETRGPNAPVNEMALVTTLSITGSEPLYDVEIEAHRISGAIQIDGAVPPASEYDDGQVVLREPSGEDRAVLGNTHDGSYDAVVVAGEYRAHFELESGGQAVPRNRSGGFQDVGVDAEEEIPLSIPTTKFSGEYRIGGTLPPVSEYDDGVLVLRSADGLDEARIGNTHEGSFDLSVVPGQYSIYYSNESAGMTAPSNLGAWIMDVDLEADQSMNIDVDAATVSGAFTIDGQVPPDSEYADGRVYLRDPVRGDSVLLGRTKDGGFSARVVPGAYELHYVEETAGAGVPGNQDARLSTIDIAGGMSFDVDIPTVTLQGAFTIASELPPATPSDSGSIYLRSGDDSILLGSTHDGDYQAQTVVGAYGIYYRRDSAAVSAAPANVNGRIGCITIE